MGIIWSPRSHASDRAVDSQPCPHCGNGDVEVFGKSIATQITWLLCRVCGHIWQAPH